MFTPQPQPHYEITLGTQELIQQLILSFPDIEIPLTQTVQYAEWQIKNKRKVIWFCIVRDGIFCGAGLAVRYHMGSTRMQYWYTPYGPVMVVPNSANIRQEIECMSRVLRQTIKSIEESLAVLNHSTNTTVFIRTDATIYTSLPQKIKGKKVYQELVPQGIQKLMPQYRLGGSYFQPRAEWHISLKQTYAEILAAMHHKTRYSIKLAEKKLAEKIVSYEVVTGKDILGHQKNFEVLMKETAERDKFCMHDHAYYKAVFTTTSRSKGGFLINVYEGVGDDQKLLVSNLIVYTETSAYYLFGTSSNSGRNLMPTYLAQWKALERSKRDGKIWYNFGGISTPNFPKFGWKGITEFKTKFGGEARVHPFMYDVPVRRFRYLGYCLVKIISYIRSYVRN